MIAASIRTYDAQGIVGRFVGDAMVLRAAAIGLLVFVLTASFGWGQKKPGGGGGTAPPPGGMPRPGGNLPSGPPDGRTGFPSTTNLLLRVVYLNERSVPDNVHVQLVSPMGVLVGDKFTRGEGQVTFDNVPPGRYSVKVTGYGVDDTIVEGINVEQYESRHFEWVHVKPPKDSQPAPTSLEGSISAVELNAPDKAKKEFRNGNEAFAKGDYKKAIERYQKAVSIYPKYGVAYNNMGSAYVKTGDTASAKDSFVKAVEADPALANANANLARLSLLEKKPAEAVLLLERGLSADPTNTEMLFLMTEAKYFIGNYEDAIVYARKVHTGQEKFPIVHLIAGKAYEAKNRMPEAKAEYELFLKESPEAPQAAQVRAVVDQMNSDLAKTDKHP